MNSPGIGNAHQESLLLLVGLEATVSELGGSVNELDVDLLQGTTAGAWVHALAERQDALVHTDSAALEHDVVVLDNTIVGESTKWVDGLLGQIVVGGGIARHELAVDLMLLIKRSST